EQSTMEVEEDHELSKMTHFKGEWYERQEAMMLAWQKQVDEEWVRWQEKELLVSVKREEKQREARVLLKVQAIAAAKAHLAQIVPNAARDLQQSAFPDSRELAIDRLFLPNLFANVQKEVQAMKQAQKQVDEMISVRFGAQQSAWREGLEAHKAKNLELQKRHVEEMQIRQGKIRIMVDNGTGTAVQVGPIQLSDKDSIDEVQDRVFVWLEKNEPKIAAAWPHGVLMLLGGTPVLAAAQLFEASAGQISMCPKPKPPPPPELDEEAVEGGDQAA
ncbi:unnamed protein product, partial [Polarella glacialis]